jgi:hypothetical protein
MNTTYELLREPFSTADAECPAFVYERGELRATFRDWREQTVRLLFHDVVGVSWDDGDAAVALCHRDDASYVVVDSEWLQRHRAVGTLTPSGEYRHFKLCFNAAGVLQVLASRLEILA